MLTKPKLMLPFQIARIFNMNSHLMVVAAVYSAVILSEVEGSRNATLK